MEASLPFSERAISKPPQFRYCVLLEKDVSGMGAMKEELAARRLPGAMSETEISCSLQSKM